MVVSRYAFSTEKSRRRQSRPQPQRFPDPLELPGGLLALRDPRGWNETPLWLPEHQTLVFADALTERTVGAPWIYWLQKLALGESSHDPASICAAQRRLYPQRSGPFFALRSSRHRLLSALFRYVQRTNRRLVHARARLRLCRPNHGQSVWISLRSHRMRLQGSEPNG